MEKLKILIAVDNHQWCWTQTMRQLSFYLHDFDIEIISAIKFKQMPSFENYDLIYMRGYAAAFINPENEDIMIPFIWTMSTGGERLSQRIMECERYGRMAQCVIAQNKLAMHALSKAGYQDVLLIPNGINLELFYPAKKKPRSIYVGCAAKMENDRMSLKGAKYVIEACKDLKLPYEEIGTTSVLTPEQMGDWYRALTVYAQPSHSEGCSNSVMEAMGCGLPVLICKKIGYHGEICNDGIENKSGEVVFVERNKKDIAEKIKYLLDHPRVYKRISRNARKFAESHDWRFMAERYRKLFRKTHEESKEKRNTILMRQNKVINQSIYDVNEASQLAKMVDDIVQHSQMPKNTVSVLKVVNMLKKGDMI